MPKENDFLITDTADFVYALADDFAKTFNKKLNEYKDIIPPRLRKKINVHIISDLTHCISQWTRTASKDAAIRRDELIEHVTKFQEKWTRRNAVTCTEWHVDKKGIIHIDRIDVLIKLDSIRAQIISHMGELPVIINELLNVTPCHEAGHVIDHIQLMEGANYEEYEKNVNKPDNDAYDEYYKWRKEFEETLDEKGRIDVEGRRLMAQKYYQCPAEARADILGGIDREKELNVIYSNMPQKGRVEIRSLSFDDKEFKRVYKEYKERQNRENS